jgi:hypothetical protein
MSARHSGSHQLSVDEGARLGIVGLFDLVNPEGYVFIEDEGEKIAVLIHPERLSALLELEEDIRDVAVISDRLANDSGRRIPLDEVISELGFSREELEASEPEM